MQYVLWTIAILFVVFVVQQIAWKFASRWWSLPCPTALAWMVDGPLVDWVSGTDLTIERMELRPGMTVVEIGPGPGRLLLRTAPRVLPGGKAIGVELQQGMLDKLRRKLLHDDPGNVELIHSDATKRVLPDGCADLVYLVHRAGRNPGPCDRLEKLPRRAASRRPAVDHRGHRRSPLSIARQGAATLPASRLRARKRHRQLANVHGKFSQAGGQRRGSGGRGWGLGKATI